MSKPNTIPSVKPGQLATSDWFDGLNKLITKATNAAFDCGEFNITAANGDEYNKLCDKSSNARAELVAYVRAALSNAQTEQRDE